MSSSNRRRVAAGALASFALAAGLGVAVKGSASAAEDDTHPLTVQRVLNDEGGQLVASVRINDFNSDDSWCIDLNGGEGSWTDTDKKVREGHAYQVIGHDVVNCNGEGYGQPGGARASVPVGLSTDKFWLTPRFR